MHIHGCRSRKRPPPPTHAATHAVLDPCHRTVGVAERVGGPMDAVTGLPVAIEPHGDTGAGTGWGRVRSRAWGLPTGLGLPGPFQPGPAHATPDSPAPSSRTTPPMAPLRPARSPADQRGDDDAPGGAAAVCVQVLLALAPPAAQPEGVEEQEDEVQGEAGQRSGPQQQQRLRVVGKQCWSRGSQADSAPNPRSGQSHRCPWPRGHRSPAPE